MCSLGTHLPAAHPEVGAHHQALLPLTYRTFLHCSHTRFPWGIKLMAMEQGTEEAAIPSESFVMECPGTCSRISTFAGSPEHHTKTGSGYPRQDCMGRG